MITHHHSFRRCLCRYLREMKLRMLNAISTQTTLPSLRSVYGVWHFPADKCLHLMAGKPDMFIVDWPNSQPLLCANLTYTHTRINVFVTPNSHTQATLHCNTSFLLAFIATQSSQSSTKYLSRNMGH